MVPPVLDRSEHFRTWRCILLCPEEGCCLFQPSARFTNLTRARGYFCVRRDSFRLFQLHSAVGALKLSFCRSVCSLSCLASRYFLSACWRRTVYLGAVSFLTPPPLRRGLVSLCLYLFSCVFLQCLWDPRQFHGGLLGRSGSLIEAAPADFVRRGGERLSTPMYFACCFISSRPFLVYFSRFFPVGSFTRSRLLDFRVAAFRCVYLMVMARFSRGSTAAVCSKRKRVWAENLSVLFLLLRTSSLSGSLWLYPAADWVNR